MTKTFSLDEINQMAEEIVLLTGSRNVLAFEAGMGAGKTTLISAICRALGVSGNIGSPTYSIINQYITISGKVIYHMDWYRLKDEEEAIAAGVEDSLYSGELCLVEWPSKASSLLPADTLFIGLEAVGARERKLIINLNN